MRSPRSGRPPAPAASEDIARFCALLFASYDAGLVEIAHGSRLGDGRLALGSRRRVGDYVPVADIGRAGAIVDRYRRAGEEVFIGVLPRRSPLPRREAVGEARCLWLDLDTPAALERALAFRAEPHLVVRSGSGGGHCYWLLGEPILPEEAECANRRLGAHLGADLASCDRLRLLRAPGSPNPKAGRTARLVRARPAQACYRLCELLAGVPAAQPETQAAMLAHPPFPRGPDPLRVLPPAWWFSRLTGQSPDAAGYARCPLHADRAASLKLYAEPERGWCCYAGCGAGSVYDFAARLWSVGTRGSEFTELRRRLRDALGV
jgi:hypothetical protein